MTNKAKTWMGVVVAAALSVQPSQAGPLTDAPSQTALEREAIGLLLKVEDAGHRLRSHADRLVQLSGDHGASRWVHYEYLEAIQHIVNHEVRPSVVRLASMRESLPEWKQEGLDRLTAVAQRLAADASAALRWKNHRATIPPSLNDEYRMFVAEVGAHIDQLTATADTVGDYAVARRQATNMGLRVRND